MGNEPVKDGDTVNVCLEGTVIGIMKCGHMVVEIKKGKNPTKIIMKGNTVAVPPKNIQIKIKQRRQPKLSGT